MQPTSWTAQNTYHVRRFMYTPWKRLSFQPAESASSAFDGQQRMTGINQQGEHRNTRSVHR